jgi:hypothetical protein
LALKPKGTLMTDEELKKLEVKIDADSADSLKLMK